MIRVQCFPFESFHECIYVFNIRIKIAYFYIEFYLFHWKKGDKIS